uniref:Uncharacterized protein n=1 Tax=Tetradesmus obliquus TaxID=3088 RepID=A0A383VYC7_TETOB|eukprot:jgi/Sobl393_1/16794/SZX69764.1
MCPCSLKRFDQLTTANGSVVDKPVKPFWWISQSFSIRHLMRNPRFAAERGQHRNGLGEFYPSPLAARMNAATGGELFKQANSGYEEAADGFQVFQHVEHDTHVHMGRCIDLSCEMQQELAMMFLMAVVPGKPKCVEAYRQLIDKEWQQLANQVRPAVRDPKR